MKDDIAIKVENLSKKFIKNDGSDFWALKDVNFEVKKGEVLGIIGENGAGKSTLLKILSSIQKPTSGTAQINGRISSILDIGTGFHPDLTGRQNIYLNGTINNLEKRHIEKVINDLIQFSELEEFIDEQVKNYSKGMYMRLAFSIFAFLKPEILLLDEVFSVGDIAFQNKCILKIESLVKFGTTILMVSHSLDEINNITKNVLIFKNGGIIFKGPVFKGIQEYANLMGTNSKDINKKNNVKIFTPPISSDKFELHKIKLINHSENDFFTTDDEIKCEIRYSLKEKSAVHIYIAIASVLGNNILFDSLGYREQNNNEIHESGSYTTSVKLPKNTFHQGVYFVSIIIADSVEEKADRIEVKKAISFEVRLNEWQNKIEALKTESIPLNPKLKWSTPTKKSTSL